MTQFTLLNDLWFFCRKAASFNRRLHLQPFGYEFNDDVTTVARSRVLFELASEAGSTLR
jgi:hypothetical protein